MPSAAARVGMAMVESQKNRSAIQSKFDQIHAQNDAKCDFVKQDYRAKIIVITLFRLSHSPRAETLREAAERKKQRQESLLNKTAAAVTTRLYTPKHVSWIFFIVRIIEMNVYR